VVGQYPSGDQGPAAAVLLVYPDRVSVDSKGNVYIADTGNNRVRKISAGRVTDIAGTGVEGSSGDGSAASAAQLNIPSGVTVDAAGNVYIYDADNFKIRKVNTSGIITTFAGNGQSGSSPDGTLATQAMLGLTGNGSLTVDSAGNVYFSDVSNFAVRKISVTTGLLTTVAGTLGTSGNTGDGGLATSATLYNPAGLAFDSAANLYIADVFNHNVREVSASTGKISTVVGTGMAGATGDGGSPTAATLGAPFDVAIDAQGDLFIVDGINNSVREVTAGLTPIINRIAGSTAGYSGDGGSATAAQLSGPTGVAVNSSGTVYIADTSNQRIRMVTAGLIYEFAGEDHDQGDGGKAIDAVLFSPDRMAWDSAGNLYIADANNNRIRKVTPSGIISTIAGTGSSVVSGDGGPAISAGIDEPAAVAVDSSGNIFIATNNQVREVDTQGNINTVVNTSNTAGFSGDGAAASAALLNYPTGLAFDSGGNLYIADSYNHRIRKVSGGSITTVAGSGPVCGNPCNNGSFTGDGGPATSATLSYPWDVAFDHSGNLLIADNGNNRIRLVDADGDINTVAGSGTNSGYMGDLGPATSALLDSPTGVAADSSGNFYIADDDNNVIRMVDAFGVISTIAGNSTVGFSGDGGPAQSAEFNDPYGVAIGPGGNVWIADTFNNRIRELTSSGPLVGNGPLGIVNAASFVSGGLVPGGMATLFGSNLTSGKGINETSGLPLATQLLNTSVKIDNTLSAPIFAVDNVNGQEQINFQVPWELAGKSTAIVQVVDNGALSPPVIVPVLAAQPGVFAYTVGSNAFGVVLHANFQLADTSNPASPGEVVLIFCTNLGAVSSAPTDGAAGSGQKTVATVTVTIGGASAPVSFAGLAANFVGLYQVNAQVPAGLAAQNQPVIVSVSGASSAPVLLPVK
jgi:trimeric autotransporter adhesin